MNCIQIIDLSGLFCPNRLINPKRPSLRSVELKGDAALFAGSGLRGDYPV